MKRPEKKASTVDKRVPMPDGDFASGYPLVTEYLCTQQYDDGSPRERSALSLFCEDGMLKLALNDKAEGRSLYVSAESLEDALELLERALHATNAPWRLWPKGRKS